MTLRLSVRMTLMPMRVSSESSYPPSMPSPAEETARTRQQNHEEHGEGDRVAIEDGAEIDRAERLDDPDEKRGEKGATHVAEAAEHDDSERLVAGDGAHRGFDEIVDEADHRAGDRGKARADEEYGVADARDGHPERGGHRGIGHGRPARDAEPGEAREQRERGE